MQPIQTSSVVTLAYERIRALILSGDVAPGTRLGQVDLADQRGFRVAALHIHDVMRRLEVRLLLEPPTARLAAERRTDAELAALAAAIVAEEHATTALAAHDASRAFHIAIAAATQNPELVMTLENLWLIEVGRRLLARRTTEADWQRADAAEHRTLLAAIDARDGERAANLMAEHVRGALRHWEPEQAHEIP
jgi:DNA-binding GntR family transcriptional regulator